MLANKLLSSLSGSESKLYVDDVFVPYVRTGTGADAVITTGIDMTKGYMLWSKGRSGATDHAIYDSARGVTYDLVSNSTAAQTTQTTGLKAVSATGHTVGSLAKMNTSAATYVDFVFRRSPKFFDVVTYTGDGTNNRTVSHNLGVAPGVVIIKDVTHSDTGWYVWHRSLPNANYYLYLNGINAQDTGANPWGGTASGVAPTSTHFTIGGSNTNQASPTTYVAYLFAHAPSADGIIQCGSYVGNGSGSNGPDVNLGWEPQYVMLKNAGNAGSWQIFDSMRDFDVSTNNATLTANTSFAEPVLLGGVKPNSTGFYIADTSSHVNTSGTAYIYLAIRRPNKPPTTGTQVYTGISSSATTGTSQSTGFAVDTQILTPRAGGTGSVWHDRLRGVSTMVTASSVPYLNSSVTSAEASSAVNAHLWNNEGFAIAPNWSGVSTMYHNFRRAPGFMDVVCYTGTGVARTVNHNLGAVPELMIVKGRNTAGDQWSVYHANLTSNGFLAPQNYLFLNSTQAIDKNINFWNDTAPTSSVFSVNAGTFVNATSHTYVAYLFATLAGISKVGSYTGNGGNQTINCAFSTGARFILIKRTDSTGDWFVWDSARGIVAGNDPHLSLNNTNAEVTTDDSIDNDNSGFIVNQVAATNINVNAASYIFLAIA